MITFILTVVFWPVTLLYLFVTYILPPIFFITFSFIPDYPISSLITFALLSFAFLRSEDSKDKKSSIGPTTKEQAIGLLRKMDASGKKKLLASLRLRNAPLAVELTEDCMTFESIWDLEEESFKILILKIRPAILGLALSLVDSKKQYRALSVIPRTNALKAFDVMEKDLSNYKCECIRAQDEILVTAIHLQRENIIQFY